MRILHIITSLQLGGAETLVTNLLPRIKDNGCEVGLVVFNGEKTELMDYLEQVTPTCKIHRFGNSYYNPWYIIKLIGVMRKYDIIHTHNSSPQLFAAIANIICRKKLVTTEHSTNNRKREQGVLLRMIDKWMYRQYDQVICISKIAEDKLRTYLGVNNKCNICTINNGVDIESFNQAKPLEGLKTSKFTIVMVAGFREAKDQDTLICAISLLPKGQYELLLVGDGVRRAELEQLTDSLNIREFVKFLGFRSDVPRILKTADVIVMSSHWEGLSLSSIEGMAAEKPFVASNVIGLREVTRDAGILFPEGDARALAHIIEQLSNNQAFYQQVAYQCNERAKQYDIRKTVEGYLHVYKSLTS